MVVTLLVTGVPRNVSLQILSYNLAQILDESEEVGKYRLREECLSSWQKRREIHIDFDSGFDAMSAQELLNDFEYVLETGQRHRLKARLTGTTSSQLLSPSSPGTRSPESGCRSLVPGYTGRQAESHLDSRLRLLEKGKKVIASEIELLRMKEKLKRKLKKYPKNSKSTDDSNRSSSSSPERSKKKKSKLRKIHKTRATSRSLSPSVKRIHKITSENTTTTSRTIATVVSRSKSRSLTPLFYRRPISSPLSPRRSRSSSKGPESIYRRPRSRIRKRSHSGARVEMETYKRSRYKDSRPRPQGSEYKYRRSKSINRYRSMERYRPPALTNYPHRFRRSRSRTRKLRTLSSPQRNRTLSSPQRRTLSTPQINKRRYPTSPDFKCKTPTPTSKQSFWGFDIAKRLKKNETANTLTGDKNCPSNKPTKATSTVIEDIILIPDDDDIKNKIKTENPTDVEDVTDKITQVSKKPAEYTKEDFKTIDTKLKYALKEIMNELNTDMSFKYVAKQNNVSLKEKEIILKRIEARIYNRLKTIFTKSMTNTMTVAGLVRYYNLTFNKAEEVNFAESIIKKVVRERDDKKETDLEVVKQEVAQEDNFEDGASFMGPTEWMAVDDLLHDIKKEDVEKQISKRPVFFLPRKILVKQMKKHLEDLEFGDETPIVDDELEYAFFKRLYVVLNQRILKLLKGKGYHSTKEIIKLYREHYSLQNDTDLVNEVYKTYTLPYDETLDFSGINKSEIKSEEQYIGNDVASAANIKESQSPQATSGITKTIIVKIKLENTAQNEDTK